MLRALKHTGLILVAMAALMMGTPAAAQDAAGDWVGMIEPVPGTRLPLVIHITRDDAGRFQGSLDSPRQGVSGIPLSDIVVDRGILTFAAPTIGGRYRGQWDPDARAWNGDWAQAGQSWPVTFLTPPPSDAFATDWQLPSSEQTRQLITARNAPRPGQGMVVGLLDPAGQRIIASGPDDKAAFDGGTLFEIGSITKVFTALLLADMVNRGEVALDDPVAKYLPQGHTLPERNGKPITLRHLATHRSGLPRMADNMGAISDPEGPFAGYTEDRLLAFLTRYALPRDPDAAWEYSNLGVGLLGYALGRAAGSDYATLVRERITAPLGMADTSVDLTAMQETRLSPGFDAYMQPAGSWDFAVVVGAGGLRSSASDMMIFAAAVLDPKSPIAPAVKTALSVRVPGEAPQVQQALGWQIAQPVPDRELLLHGGETAGYRAVLALDPAKGRGVVVLANSAAEPSVIDLALHMLFGTPVAPTPALPPAPRLRIATSLTMVQLDRIVGRYDFGDGFVLAITRAGDRLHARREDIAGASALPILPESELSFFWKDVDAQLLFTLNPDGQIVGAEIVQGGVAVKGTRLSM